MPGNVRNTGQNERPTMTAASRTRSLDCLADKSDKGNEYVPSRITRTQPKIKSDAMQFVKTGPATLYKSATEQIKKAEAVKAMRKNLIAEEEDWQQQPSSSSTKTPLDEDTDWQSNLDKWKSSRRKRNEDALERVIEIKRNEQEEEFNRTRRKSKTFSEMQEEKNKRGRRYNLVVHDDDNNDLADLGLSSVKSSSSLYDTQEENDAKDLDQDNKDAKSDAGFCTGSDTGSDGVFAEDNISDTSSALGDKKETHDSLLDPGVSKEEEPRLNGHGSSLTSDILNTNTANLLAEEYTYDKAIEGYKQYAENSAKKRTSSITSLNSNTSYTKEEEKKEERSRLNGRSPSPAKSSKLEEKLSFFTKEMAKDSQEPRVVMREKSPKVDVGKRRSMFEMGEPLITQNEKEQKQANRRSLEVPGSLRNKVASFENLDVETPKVRGVTPVIETNLKSKVKSFENLDAEAPKVRGVTPTRDTKFHEKLASFAAADTESLPVRKKTPERDVNFHKKLASFTSIENGEEEKSVERKTIPVRDPSLKNKIASFEQLEQAAETTHTQLQREESMKNRDRSISLENLDDPQPVKEVMRPAVSMGNMGLLRRTPSTPFMVVDLESTGVEEETCVREKRPVVSDKQDSAGARDPAKRSTIYETIEKCQVIRDVESAPMYSIFQYLSPEVNAQVFEIASKLEETPLIGSPTHKAPTAPLPEPPLQEEDSFDGAKPYTDEDINEVISDYEQVGSVYEESSEHVENIYENITEEPVYENIYEKVGDETQGETEEPFNEPHYQTLEEVREEIGSSSEVSQALPSPPQTSAPKSHQNEVPVVIDVTWTDGPSQAAPPCEPPPPPPPDDDSDDDASDQPQGLPVEAEDGPFTRENSTRRIKKELWKRRSDFLGTSSQYIEEEPSAKPPPELSELLRQEREAERIMAESQRAKTPSQETLTREEIARREKEIIENLERSEQLKQQQQQQYTWQEQITKETITEEQKQLSEHLEYQVAENESSSSESDKDIMVATVVPVDSANIPPTSQSDLDTNELETTEMSSQTPTDTFEALPITSDDNIESVETKAEMLETHIDLNTVVAKVQLTQTEMRVEAESNVQPESREESTELLESHYSTLDYSSDSVASTGSQPDPYKKLAELEEEMLRHDQDMLQRASKLSFKPANSNDVQPGHIPPPTMYATHEEEAMITSVQQSPQSTESTSYNYQSQTPQLPIQEFYTAPSYEPTPPNSLAATEGMESQDQKAVAPPTGSPSQYSTLASPHPFTRSHSQSSIGTPIHPPLQGVRSSPTGSPRDPVPEPLPRKKKLPPPPPSKPLHMVGDSAERSEALRLSRMPSGPVNAPSQQDNQGESVSPSGQQMSKQTLLALSAIPKPRLTDNESWITKKKPEARRDYSKHWLHQEAEQRRLEQQDRVTRQQNRVPSSKTVPTQPVSPQHPAHSQNTSYLPTQSTVTYPPQNTSPTYSSYPQSLKNPSPSHSNNNNNSWRNQATTYQPHVPTQAPNGDKALPDSIIHNLTQRVNNKNSKNTYSNSNGRLGNNYSNNNYRDENYHDYMNADALSASTGHSPIYQSGMAQNQQQSFNSQSQDHSSGQDQRLLSVSGKKKCSHCSEELGRGAAMIIESLRLFYHIPCFKCCVCGIQLGNGSSGADVRVRNHKLHCHNCYSNDEGMKFSKV